MRAPGMRAAWEEEAVSPARPVHQALFPGRWDGSEAGTAGVG